MSASKPLRGVASSKEVTSGERKEGKLSDIEFRGAAPRNEPAEPRYTLKAVRGLVRSNWDLRWQDFPLDVMESVQMQLRIIQIALDHPHAEDNLSTIISELSDIQGRLATACELYEHEMKAHRARGVQASHENGGAS